MLCVNCSISSVESDLSFEISKILQERYKGFIVLPRFIRNKVHYYFIISDSSEMARTDSFVIKLYDKSYKGKCFIEDSSNRIKYYQEQQTIKYNNGNLKVTFTGYTAIEKPGDIFQCKAVVRNIGDSVITIPKPTTYSTIPMSITINQRSKHSNYVLQPNKTITVDILMNVPNDYTHPCVQSPMLAFYDNTLKKDFIVIMRPNFIPVLANLPSNINEIDDEEDISTVWDEKQRSIIPLIPCSNIGQIFLQNNIFESKYYRQIFDYNIPDNYNSLLEQQDIKFIGKAWGRKSNDTRKEFLHELLFLEESYKRKQLQRFNIGCISLRYYINLNDNTNININNTNNINLTNNNNNNIFLLSLINQGECLLSVIIDNVSDNKSFININDIIYIWDNNQNQNEEYEGRIIDIKNNNEIIFLVSSSFKKKYSENNIKNNLFNIRFIESRYIWKNLHRAIDKVNFNLLFPPKTPKLNKSTPKHINDSSKIQLYNRNLNKEQCEAIMKIINFEYKGTPFLILGPFGTGKSTCITECILQVLKYKVRPRILVSTKTNIHADIIIKKLSEYLTPKELHRAAEPYYKIYDSSIIKYFSYNSNSFLNDLLSLDDYIKIPVIVTTNYFTSYLYSIGMDSDFSHLFIDECGQLFQPDILLPLCLVNEQSNIILSGDYHQVSPKVYSKSAKSKIMRLDCSPLEELYKRFGWYTSTNSDRYLQKLITQYKTPQLISIFTYENFYSDYKIKWKYSQELYQIPSFSKNTILSLGFIKTFYPIGFRQFKGKEVKDNNSFSIYNPAEATELCRIIQLFLSSDSSINPSDIAIISEQYKQRQYIRQLLKNERIRGCNNIFIGSSLLIQGKQFLYTFISPTICRDNNNDSSNIIDNNNIDNNNLYNNTYREIWRDYKKLNTIITRSLKLVYIVGDSYTLNYLDNWNNLINFCKLNDSFIDKIDKISHSNNNNTTIDNNYLLSSVNDSSIPLSSPSSSSHQQSDDIQTPINLNESNFPSLASLSKTSIQNEKKLNLDKPLFNNWSSILKEKDNNSNTNSFSQQSTKSIFNQESEIEFPSLVKNETKKSPTETNPSITKEEPLFRNWGTTTIKDNEYQFDPTIRKSSLPSTNYYPPPPSSSQSIPGPSFVPSSIQYGTNPTPPPSSQSFIPQQPSTLSPNLPPTIPPISMNSNFTTNPSSTNTTPRQETPNIIFNHIHINVKTSAERPTLSITMPDGVIHYLPITSQQDLLTLAVSKNGKPSSIIYL